MPTYIISSHGAHDYKQKARIPSNTTVLFYQRFGTEMLNNVGFALQTALAHPNDPRSAQTLAVNKSVALWNGIPVDNLRGNGALPCSEQGPEIILTGDNEAFRTGIVLADKNEVIFEIGKNQLITLSYALDLIRNHANQHYGSLSKVAAHCLFCL
ncbi:MAG TPA: hypothetical protein VJ810_29405 [Blastocatellia bacterium]|nr:hypothetical protein [Blastocatellia bacterium]